MGTLLQDVRYGARTLAKNPGFALVIALTLSLAIGANSVLFSFVNVLLLRPLPIKEIEGVAFIEGLNAQRGDERLRISAPDFLDFQERSTRFGELGAYRWVVYTLTGEGDPQRITAADATASFFQIWGLDAVKGRPFLPEEDRPGAPGVVILSHGFWTRKLAADPAVIGRVLTLNGAPHTVVGVLSPAIEIGGLGTIEVWTPLAVDRATANRNERTLRVTGRLAPGSSVEQASAEIATLARQLQREYPDTNTGFEAAVWGVRESLLGGAQTYLILALLGVFVAGVLAVGCSNVANLMLARAVGRRRELAIRSALGASRRRLVRQLLTESLLLSLLGGLGGVVMAWAALRVIRAAAFEPIFARFVVDGDVFAFAAALSLITPVVFGLLPALRASSSDAGETLKESGGRGSGGLRGRRSRNALVVSQLALACALLICAGLILRTVHEVVRIDWGFEHRNLLTFQLELPETRYAGDDQVRGFFDQVLPRLRALPGVQTAAAADPLPIFGGERTVQLELEGQTAARKEDRPWAVAVFISDEYTRTLDLPLLQGRSITVHDGPEAARVAMVTQELARRYWPDADPLGRRLAIRSEGQGEEAEWVEVVGVTGDLRSPDLTVAPKPTVFLPISQSPQRAAAVMVRATTDPTSLAPAIRREIRLADAELAIYQLQTMEQTSREQGSSDQVLLGMFTSFALVALLMAAAGLYASMSYSVSQRKQEIGIRLALGARGSLGRAIASLLYGVTATDPLTYAGVALVLLGVALLASYVPAVRATRIDPIETLRVQ